MSFKRFCVMRPLSHSVIFFNNSSSTLIYTLSLHDALPIYLDARLEHGDLGGAAGSGVAFVTHLGGRHGQLDVRWQLESDRVPVELLDEDVEVVNEQVLGVAHDRRAEREGLEAVLVHEVKAVAVGIEIRRRRADEVGLLELLPRLECFVEDRA